MSRVTIGLSGYSYKPWQGEGRFYPAELKQKEFLAYYASNFNGVEIDATWYRMPSEAAVQAWIDGTPDGFQFTFKAHRKISHLSRLKEDCFDSVDFLVQRLKPMATAGKLGAVFVQLPPNFKKNIERLETFVDHLNPSIPWGMEFRNTTWNDEEVSDLLRSKQVSWVSWDTDDEAGIQRDTGKVVYARMRRDAYDDDVLDSWASWFRANSSAGKDCLIFFKHEDDGSPWIDAGRMKQRLA